MARGKTIISHNINLGTAHHTTTWNREGWNNMGGHKWGRARTNTHTHTLFQNGTKVLCETGMASMEACFSRKASEQVVGG